MYNLKGALYGLFLMVLFTSVWAFGAEYFFNGADFRIVGIIFFLLVVYFGATYFKFLTFVRKYKILPGVEEVNADKKKGKYISIISGLEGFAIFITYNILVNTNRTELFIPMAALIVGVHFIPLGLVFKRKTDYYIAAFSCAISLSGLFLIISKTMPENYANAFVCSGMAISTTVTALLMINKGNEFIRDSISL